MRLARHPILDGNNRTPVCLVQVLPFLHPPGSARTETRAGRFERRWLAANVISPHGSRVLCHFIRKVHSSAMGSEARGLPEKSGRERLLAHFLALQERMMLPGLQEHQPPCHHPSFTAQTETRAARRHPLPISTMPNP